MNRKSLIMLIILSIFTIVFASVLNNLIKKNDSKFQSKQQIEKISQNDEHAIYTANSNEKKVSPTANIIVKQLYKDCGHVVTNKFMVPEEIVNKTEDEVKKYYFGWILKNFSSTEIEIYKEVPGICDEHYIIRDVDGTVVVYNIDDEKNENLYAVTEILTKYLPKEDEEKLKQGICIVGKENLFNLLQDYE